MFDTYLIDMKTQYLSRLKGTSVIVSKYTPAFGPEQKDEVGDITIFGATVEKEYHTKHYEVQYHEHLDGCETFFIVEGDWEVMSMGEKYKAYPGDILHVQPFQGHGLRALCDYARVIVLFQGKDMRYAKERSDYLNAHFPELAQTPEYKNLIRTVGNNQNRDGSYYYDTAPEGDSSALRRFGKGIRTHEMPGLTLNLTVARYETHGVKEIWEACMKKGLKLEFPMPRYDHRLFWVREGSVKFNIDGTEFAAKPDMLVYVPPYHTFTFEAEEDSNMVDLSCPYVLQDLLEELRLLKAKRPEKLDDEAFMSELLAAYKADPVKYSYNGITKI